MNEWIIQFILLPWTIVIFVLHIVGSIIRYPANLIGYQKGWDMIWEDLMGIITLFYLWILACLAWITAALGVADKSNPFLAAAAAIF